MNYRIVGYIFFLICCCVGCQSIKVDKSTMHTAVKNPIAPGLIGVQKNGMYASEFQASAIPEYKKRIRVNATRVDFSQTTFKAYLNVSKGNKQQIKYVDSLESKPRFMTFELLDRVTILSELQKEYNVEALTYIKNQKEASIVTSISLAIPESLMQEIEQAEAVFIGSGAYKQYELSLIKDGRKYKEIDFSSTTIFAYGLSFFCWGENDRRQIMLADIIGEKSSCPKNAYRDAEKATAKMNYFKL
ncbi:hypothetical protein [Aquimarina sp. I32.4]|uniref:hypothetical protein n=1 Tax=Aquimarina sp. I32.4 TaxID=2053903 RepID=UPI0011AF8F37|nr:hypothetical protein [Aquimarina sp. I32.4]